VKPVCLVIGAGAGIGGNVARRFAQEGYHACLCRRTDEAGLNKLVESIEREIGDRSLADTSYKAFERCWRLATFGLFRVASVVCPLMAERGKGTILVTSATAAMRGNAGQHAHASAMAGRRMLCQSLNAEFSPKGIHVAHILIDGSVDAPDTLGKMLGPEKFKELRETRGMEHDGLVLPEKVAETYVHLVRQHRSAWTFEIDLRSFSDIPWWNH
jgi:NAD(P)-dependent dehydrogenase (short-subunit alcohol dehydrogenase family)